MPDNTVGSNTKSYSFDLPDDYGLKQADMPKGVKIDETTQTVTIDISQVDTVQLAEYLEENKVTNEYFANSSNPQLDEPDPDSKSDGVSPYEQGSIERFLVQQQYITNLKKALSDQGITGDDATRLVEYQVNGTGTVTSAEAKLLTKADKTATTETRGQARLPETWTLEAEDDTSWTRITSEIEGEEQVNVNPVSSSNVNMLRMNLLTDSTDAYIQDMEEAINQKIQALKDSGIPDEDPRIVGFGNLLEYLKVTAKALAELKKTLEQLQIADSVMSDKKIQMKLDMLKQKNETATEQYENIAEKIHKQRTMGGLQEHMKWIGPTVTALVSFVGVLVAVASLGTLTAAGIALIALGIALGCALTAYSIADSCTGISQDLVDLFKDWLEDQVEGIEPDWVKDMCQALLTIAVLAPLIIALVIAVVTGSGAGAAASVGVNIAANSAVQIGKQLVMSGMQQIFATLLITLLMASDGIPNLMAELTKACGGDEDAQQAMKIYAMIATCVAVVGGMTLAAGAANSIKGVVSNIVSKFSSTAKQSAQAAQTAPQTIKEANDLIEKAIKEATELVLKACDKSPNYVLLKIQNALHGFTKSISENALQNARTFERILRNVPYGIDIVHSGYKGYLLISLANLTEEAGDLEARQAMIKALMTMIQSIIDNLLTGISDMGDTVSDLGNASARLFNQADNSFNAVARSILG